MDLVSYTLKDNIATIAMDDGKANVISADMVSELHEALDRAERAHAVVVLTGRPGVFCGGFDLGVLNEGIEAAAALMQMGGELSRRLLAFPSPVIAAASGHAIAMGAFLLLCCDYRTGIEGDFKLGLNEVAIGMTMPNVGIELARGRLTRRHFNRAVINAEMFAPAAAMEAGFLDRVVEPDGFDAAVREQAQAMLALNREAFRNTKRKARKSLLGKLEWAMKQDADDFVTLLDALSQSN